MQQADFEAELKSAGYTEIEIAIGPRPVNHSRTHDYDIRGLVLSGIFIVSQGGEARDLSRRRQRAGEPQSLRGDRGGGGADCGWEEVLGKDDCTRRQHHVQEVASRRRASAWLSRVVRVRGHIAAAGQQPRD